jgi:anti-sigma factor RsiW
MLTCRELTELITDYLEGRLPLSRRLSFRLHVMMCRYCREYLRQMRITVRTMGAMPAEPIPPEVCEQLLKSFRNWKSTAGSA